MNDSDKDRQAGRQAMWKRDRRAAWKCVEGNIGVTWCHFVLIRGGNWTQPPSGTLFPGNYPSNGDRGRSEFQHRRRRGWRSSTLATPSQPRAHWTFIWIASPPTNSGSWCCWCISGRRPMTMMMMMTWRRSLPIRLRSFSPSNEFHWSWLFLLFLIAGLAVDVGYYYQSFQNYRHHSPHLSADLTYSQRDVQRVE